VGRPASDVRDQIVDAALELLLTTGARGVVQTRVAKAAGVPQGHLTYYFPKKSDLLVAVARRFREHTAREVAEFFGAERRSSGTREERLMAVVRMMSENRERTRALVGLMMEAEREPALRAELHTGIDNMRAFLAAVLGKSEPDADVDVFLALYWGLGIQHLVLGSRRSPEYRRTLIERAGAVLRGLLRRAD
jgi:DNA-binding transcriptional regulator YbjK